MSSDREYRLYAFVAGSYLSPLQRGLQTAHVVSEMFARMSYWDQAGSLMTWAQMDKTIIILDAGNHQGVLDCWTELSRTGIEPGFVEGALFREDKQSMNGMATACGVIVPRKYWSTEPKWGDGIGVVDEWVSTMTEDNHKFSVNYSEGQFISCLKKYRLAAN